MPQPNRATRKQHLEVESIHITKYICNFVVKDPQIWVLCAEMGATVMVCIFRSGLVTPILVSSWVLFVFLIFK